MRFIDETKVQVQAGSGGDGFVGWRREKFVPHGGPDGGDGGNGGAVIFKTDPGLNTLIDFALNPLIRAEAGGAGGVKQLHGKDGENAVRYVPVGTQVFFEGELVADLATDNSTWVAARGGRGGKGNAFFKSAGNQAPDKAQPGQPGEEFEFTLVLKSVADVGLVGLPNTGKSSFIRAVSRATPKVGDYPFTTIRPNLGVVTPEAGKPFVIADIPGLIPGAHEGKGLGLDFLKHIERTSVLCHFVDVSLHFNEVEAESIAELSALTLKQLEAIEKELALFSAELLKKPRVIVFTKQDLTPTEAVFSLLKPELEHRADGLFLISSTHSTGLGELSNRLAELSREEKPAK